MDKQISEDLFEVENPVYQSYADIEKQYYGQRIVITNMQLSENRKDKLFKGGIVRYYGSKYSREVYEQWGKCFVIDGYAPVILYNFELLDWGLYKILNADFFYNYPTPPKS